MLFRSGVALKSLQESIDTSTPTGKLVFHIFGALAEFERQLIVKRTQAGLSAARARGRLGGRPKTLDADKKQVVIDLYNERKLPVKKICEMMGISKPTLYNYVRDYVPKRIFEPAWRLRLIVSGVRRDEAAVRSQSVTATAPDFI